MGKRCSVAEKPVTENGVVRGLKLKLALDGTVVVSRWVPWVGEVGLEESICISSTTIVLNVGDGLDGRGEEEAAPGVSLPGKLAICRIVVH